MKRLTIFIICALIFSGVRAATDRVFEKGEELLYEVSYLGIGLGTIKVVTEGADTLDGKDVRKAKCIIKSYPAIKFAEVGAVFETWMDPTLSYSDKFVASTKYKDRWIFHKTLFDYDKWKIFHERWDKNKKVIDREYDIDKKWTDGLSLFFLARKYTRLGKNIRVYTMMDVDTNSTTLNFQSIREDVEIDAVDYPVKTIYFDGKARWKGIYGLSGDFEGWFSDDDARVPIQAYLKVYLGKIRVELISWKKPDWSPPKAD